jgi:hypothetical protein
MAYIGSPPLERGTGLFSQDTFTGDGSTTTFDLTNIAPDGGGNELQVFVANVRQQEGVSNAYTLGFDGSSELKRITFTSAPEAGEPIFVLNPGTRNAQQLNVVNDNTITAAKLQSNAITTAKITDANVTTAKIEADAITEAKIADNAISEEHLDTTVVTGLTELSEEANNSDTLIVYDASAGALKKILRSNLVLQGPTVSSVSPTSVVSGDGTGNYTFTITGTGFTGGSASLINNSGTTVDFDTVTVDSATQITGVIAKSSLTNAGEPYDVKVTGSNNIASTLENQINIDASPTYNTAAGSIGSVPDGGRGSTTLEIEAFDPESAGNVTFEIQSGSLPAGVSTTTVNENGVSKFQISGFSAVVSNTTSNFVIRAVDAASNTSSRSFSITILAPASESFTSSSTFSVPAGVTSVDALVVAGGGGGGGSSAQSAPAGGGGAGGLIFFPAYPVTASGTITVTVGCGGGGGPSSATGGTVGQDSVFGSPGDPGLGQGGVLTAKGGGGGGTYCVVAGGGGSGSGGAPHPVGVVSGSTATQPTQPGNSGAYGFGNPGGQSSPYANPASPGAGGGGGAGAAGANGNPWPTVPREGGDGGIGRAYTIADGTTPVYYAGGGGGGGGNTTSGVGGQGGGGNGLTSTNIPCKSVTPGQANTGGGGGGSGTDGSNPNGAGGQGGKGIVIVRY